MTDWLQGLLPDRTNLAALAVFLGCVLGALLVGYLIGRGGRSAPPARPSPEPSKGGATRRPAPLVVADAAPAPAADEARLMDISAIRAAETEPPLPLDLGPSSRR